MDINRSIYKAKSLCSGYYTYVKAFGKIYTFTTENISAYIDYFDLKDKSLLTVGSSGDQVLNAYLKGCRDITLFDLNEFAEAYTNLKISAISALSYKEFQAFFFRLGLNKYENKEMFSKETYNKIKPFLKKNNYEAYLFFDEIINNYSKEQIRSNLFNDNEYRNSVIKDFNDYLKTEQNYNALKSIINDISFKYINGDIFSTKLNEKYDNIFLSNICTYNTLKTLKKLLNTLKENNLNLDGSILLGYLWNIRYESDYYENNWKEIYKMPVVREVLKDYITEAHTLYSKAEILRGTNDLALIYRKK